MCGVCRVLLVDSLQLLFSSYTLVYAVVTYYLASFVSLDCPADFAPLLPHPYRQPKLCARKSFKDR